MRAGWCSIGEGASVGNLASGRLIHQGWEAQAMEQSGLITLAVSIYGFKLFPSVVGHF